MLIFFINQSLLGGEFLPHSLPNFQVTFAFKDGQLLDDMCTCVPCRVRCILRRDGGLFGSFVVVHGLDRCVEYCLGYFVGRRWWRIFFFKRAVTIVSRRLCCCYIRCGYELFEHCSFVSCEVELFGSSCWFFARRCLLLEYVGFSGFFRSMYCRSLLVVLFAGFSVNVS